MRLLIIAGIFLFGSALADSQPPLVAEINGEKDSLDLTPYVLILKDVDRILDINQICVTDATLPLRRLEESGTSLGFDDSVYWLKFTLAVSPMLRETLVLHFGYPVVDHISLFTPDRFGGFKEQRLGEVHPISEREIALRHPVFKLEQSPGSTKTYYMRIQTGGTLQIPLHVMTSSGLTEYIDKSNLAYGFYYGVMLVLFFVALVAYKYLRHTLYMSYALYLLSFMFFQLTLNGFGSQYFWPDIGYLVNNLNSVAMALVVVCGLWFAGNFLKIWSDNGVLKYLYLVVIIIGAATALVALFGYADLSIRIGAALGIVFVVLVVVSAIRAVIKGTRSASFFLAAWGVFLVGVLITWLNYFGFLENNFITYNAMQIASLFEILILGYVLLDNVSILYFERKAAMKATSHLLVRINQDLEAEVTSRIDELREKNRMLSDLALRDSMTGLLNHNAVMEQLDLLISNAKRYKQKLSLVMLDIDYFKRINDRHGHKAGDQVIVEVSKVLKESVRQADSCGRYGGGSFIILLPQTSGRNATEVAESIRKKLRKLRVAEIAHEPFSISAGVAEFDLTDSFDAPLKQVDMALYEAKVSGRNRVVFLQDGGFEDMTDYGDPEPDSVF